MNTQPLNLLTTAQVASDGSSGASSGRSQQHSMNDEERQLALASIFSSLTSLATHTQQHAGNQSQTQPQPQYNYHHLQQSKTSLENPSKPKINPRQDGQRGAENPPNTGAPTALNNNLTLSNSIQSVMAAAMMQQQLAAAANQQHNQQNNQKPIFLGEQQQAPNMMFGDEHADLIDCSQSQPQHLSLQQQSAPSHNCQPQMQQQRINYCTICNKELCNKYFMKTHMLKMHGINLEMEPPDSVDGEQEQSGEDGQAIDEVDDIDGADDEQTEQINSSECPSSSKKSSCTKKLKSSSSTVINSGSFKSKQATSVMNGFAGNSMGGVVCDICNKELCSKYFLKVHKQNTHGIMTDYQDAANQFAMYPFAGPMAGQLYPQPLPPNLPAQAAPFPANPLSLFGSASPTNIINCTVAGQQRISDESPSAKNKSSAIKRSRLGQPASKNQAPAHTSQSNSANIEKTGGEPTVARNGSQFESIYRLILAQQQPLASTQAALAAQHQQQQAAALGSSSLAPQLQSPAQLMPIDPNASLAMTANPLGALMCFGAMGHPSGPFGPAAMSPAMIVDNILRNQHLFARNGANAPGVSSTKQTRPAVKTAGATSSAADKNNNNSGSSKQGGKASKDSANNSRYFSHYTEACPMCDRRFKSIKWLKTHMMNDHKQEIGAYMQMMMQYLYASKTSQQMAAAATLAAIEQQQQQQQFQQQQQKHLAHQQLLKSNQNHRNSPMMQQQQPTSLLSNCFNPKSPYVRQQQPHQGHIDQNNHNQSYEHYQQQQQHQSQQQSSLSHYYQNRPNIGLNLSPTMPESAHHLTHLQQQGISDFVIDARCNQESLSPGNSPLNQRSPNSPSARQSQMNLNTTDSDNYLVFGLNFELSQLASSHRAADKFHRLQSHGSPSQPGSDIGVDDTSGDSDRLTTRGDDDDETDVREASDRKSDDKLARTSPPDDDGTNGSQHQMCIKATKSAAS